MSPTPPLPVKDWMIIVIGALLCLCGSGPFYVMPDYLESAVRDFGLNAAQAGWLTGAEGLGIAVACVATGVWARRLSWTWVLAAAAASALGNSLVVVTHGFGPILALRALTGLLGEGPLYAMSYVLLGKASNPDRAFGVAVTALAVVSAAALHFEPSLYGAFGPGGILVPFAGLALIVAGLTIGSRRLDLRPSAPAASRETVRWSAVLILLSVGVWSAGPGAFWPFSEAAAVAMRVPAPVIAQALSVSLLIGLSGAILPALIGDRFGRLAPTVVATVGAAVAITVFFARADILALTAALSLLQFSWNLAVVYQLAGLATVDTHGRYSALGAVAQFGGIALGPVVAGLATEHAGFGALTTVVCGFVGLGLALFVAGQRLDRTVKSVLRAGA